MLHLFCIKFTFSLLEENFHKHMNIEVVKIIHSFHIGNSLDSKKTI